MNDQLSPREREIIGLLAEHLTTAQVAERLHISQHTVRSHVKNVLYKLCVHTRAEAIRLLVSRHDAEGPVQIEELELTITNHAQLSSSVDWDTVSRQSVSGTFGGTLPLKQAAEYMQRLERLGRPPHPFTCYLELPDGTRIPLEFRTRPLTLAGG